MVRRHLPVSRSTHLDKLDDLLPKDLKQLDILWYATELLYRCPLLFFFFALPLL